MPHQLSPHAKTILAIINNIGELCVKHHEYAMARDTLRALEKICESFGFGVDKEIFRYILNAVGTKPPKAMADELDMFISEIIGLDNKLGNDPIAGDKKYERNEYRNNRP